MPWNTQDAINDDDYNDANEQVTFKKVMILDNNSTKAHLISIDERKDTADQVIEYMDFAGISSDSDWMEVTKIVLA